MFQELKISGDFTTERALDFKARLHEMAVVSDVLTIDLLHTVTADIVGVNVLVTTHKLLVDKNKKLLLKVAPESELYTLLKLTKFTNILNIN